MRFKEGSPPTDAKTWCPRGDLHIHKGRLCKLMFGAWCLSIQRRGIRGDFYFYTGCRCRDIVLGVVSAWWRIFVNTWVSQNIHNRNKRYWSNGILLKRMEQRGALTHRRQNRAAHRRRCWRGVLQRYFLVLFDFFAPVTGFPLKFLGDITVLSW